MIEKNNELYEIMIHYLNISFLYVATMLFANTVWAEPGNDWIYDEVLTQLHELRGEIKSINNELAQIREGMKSLQPRTRPQAKLPEYIDINESPVLGKDDARLAIVEVFDFQCPYCKRHYKNTFGKLKDNYITTGKIKYAAMDYPLSFHRQAESAAIAARCAGEQDKYWEMHSELLGGNSVLNEARYLELAKIMNLDESQYGKCLGSDEIKQRVQASASYGEKLGVRGTPAFFIGKLKGDKLTDIKMLSGAQPYDRFARIIEGMLKEEL